MKDSYDRSYESGSMSFGLTKIGSGAHMLREPSTLQLRNIF